MSDWETELRREREEKDRFFAEHPNSPLPAAEREGFDGLKYFPPDKSYQFELDLRESENRETLVVETTRDGERTYHRWGEFRFDLDGEERRLVAYRDDPNEDRLWVPFRDETSGEETYGAGRYLDLDPADRTDDGRWVLNFNRAYSPFCAYNDAYECPLVPVENWLEVRIEAGERVA